jgi:hypothetical protein
VKSGTYPLEHAAAAAAAANVAVCDGSQSGNYQLKHAAAANVAFL